jgi:hypothetical protein
VQGSPPHLLAREGLDRLPTEGGRRGHQGILRPKGRFPNRGLRLVLWASDPRSRPLWMAPRTLLDPGTSLSHPTGPGTLGVSIWGTPTPSARSHARGGTEAEKSGSRTSCKGVLSSATRC